MSKGIILRPEGCTERVMARYKYTFAALYNRGQSLEISYSKQASRQEITLHYQLQLNLSSSYSGSSPADSLPQTPHSGSSPRHS